MGRIQRLPELLVKQIAAGEVVERPASVVKELVENSVDAGATRVEVRIRRAGAALVEVEDDGCGMDAEDARLAFVRHATSKIRTLEDLQQATSCGFRGEALAAIAAVARVRLHTATEGAAEGVEAICEGGGEVVVRPAPPRRGTRVSVRDLFFNTPARRRFLRAPATEEAWIVDTVRALALAHPQVGMRLEMDGRLRLDAPPSDARRRAAAILGRDFAQAHATAEITMDGVQVFGCFGHPQLARRDASRVWLIVNGRPVRDRMLAAALRAAYRDLTEGERYPVAALWIVLEPRLVDVNIHPTKREVRFARPQAVRAAVAACARQALAQLGREAAPAPRPRAQPAPSVSYAGEAARAPANPTPYAAEPIRAPAGLDGVQAALLAAAEPAPEARPSFGRALAQLHGRFVLAETEDGLLVVDQHAAHERIVYERMKAALREGAIPAQRLALAPVWRPEPQEAAWLAAHGEGLRRLGLALEARGDGAWHVRAVPAPLADQDPVQLAREVVAALAEGGEGQDLALAALRKWFADRACRAAIKFGRRMSLEEMQALLDEMAITPNIARCNHGRPTFVRVSLTEMERWFHR